MWEGMERVHRPDRHARDGCGTSSSTSVSIRHAGRHRDVCLTFGYNTAVFNIAAAAAAASPTSSTWTASSGRGRAGGSLARGSCTSTSGSRASSATTSSPTTRRSSATSRRVRPPARSRPSPTAPHAGRRRAGRAPSTSALEPGRYLTLIGRPIPENSILELVQGFSRPARGVGSPCSATSRRTRMPTIVRSWTRRATRSCSSGAIYEPRRVPALRFHSTRLPARPHGRRHEPVAGRGAGRREPGDRPRQRLQPLGRAATAAAYFTTTDDVDAPARRDPRRPRAAPSDAAPQPQPAR